MNDAYEPTGRIVVGVDCSPEGDEVIRWADRQAEMTGAPLLALTAWQEDLFGAGWDVEWEPARQRMRQALFTAVGTVLRPERSRLATLRTSPRRPEAALLHQARRAGLLVVGAHRAGIARFRLGSVTKRVARNAPCPVAIVPATPRPVAHRIVVGLDGSESSQAALVWATRQAALSGAKVDALAVGNGDAYLAPSGPILTAEQWADELVHEATEDLPTTQSALVTAHTAFGDPATELTAIAAHADLIVLGAIGGWSTAGRLLGSVSQRVARQSIVPVVLVHELACARSRACED